MKRLKKELLHIWLGLMVMMFVFGGACAVYLVITCFPRWALIGIVILILAWIIGFVGSYD